MLTDVHRITPRAKVAFGDAASRQAFRPIGVALLKTRHRQQTRAYRFDIWSSYLGPEFYKDLRRRQRTMKRKLAEGLIRKLSWDGHPFAKDPRDALTRIIERHSIYEAPSRSRFVNPDSSFDFDGSSKKSDTNKGHTRNSYDPFSWLQSSIMSDFDKIFNEWSKQAVKGAKQAKSDLHPSNPRVKADARSNAMEETTTKRVEEDEDYVIDPISNRKIPRDVYESMDAKTETPARTFKSYRSQFSHFAPPASEVDRPVVHSDGPPPPDELKKYRQVHIDPNPAGVNSACQNTTTVPPEEFKIYENPIVQSGKHSLNPLPPDEPNDTYDDLHKYKPYMHNEPTGSLNEEAPKYGDLHKYKPHMYNEDAAVEDNANTYDDLDKYGPYMYKEDVKVDESSPKYDDLDKYNPTEFKDPTSTTSEQPFSQYGDLDQYKMYRYQEPDGKPVPEKDIVAECLKDYEANVGESKLERPKPTIAERLQKLDLAEAESQVKAAQSLKTNVSSSETTSRDDLESAMDTHREASDAVDREAFTSIRELRGRKESQATQTSNPTMTGNYVRDFPEEFTQSWVAPTGSSTLQLKTSEAQSSHDTTSKGLDAVDEGEPSGASKLETALDRQNKSNLGFHAREKAEIDPYSKEPQGLETSYAEECGGKPTWPTFVKTYSIDKDADAQKTQSTPSHATAGSYNAYHRDPEVDGLPSKDTLESTATADSSQAAAPEKEPTLYKVLAYDPTTQNISTAETTSVMPDEAAPLTPAEVLLRLSNPTRFLPHFAPLQAEGFEIASGGGDVLVFRKVRAPSPASDAKTQRINPIDMMGRPAPLPSATAFTSPTGFLNYDLPPATATAVEEEAIAASTANTTSTSPSSLSSSSSSSSPGVESNVVRREEPVFSGGHRTKIGSRVRAEKAAPNMHSREEGNEKTGGKTKEKGKKVGVGRRMLIAGAWVAGISYALGVMGDYFITGGVDGRGPVGF